jgi:hypothetical protein
MPKPAHCRQSGLRAGRTVEDVGSGPGRVQAHDLPWKSKYGGMEVSEAQEVKQLREENARLGASKHHHYENGLRQA